MAVVMVAGCKRQPPPDVPQPPSATTNAAPAAESSAKSNTTDNSGSPITAPVDYVGAVVQAQQTATKRIDVAQIQHAIQEFNAGEGRYPKDLNEIVTEHYLSKVPALPRGMEYSYDSAQGTISVVKK